MAKISQRRSSARPGSAPEKNGPSTPGAVAVGRVTPTKRQHELLVELRGGPVRREQPPANAALSEQLPTDIETRAAEVAATNNAVVFPASMMRYMTFELSEALALLSQQQVDAIFRIVESGHLVDDPPAPYALIRGDRPICAESTWKRVGKQDEKGEWVERPGWSRQTEFLAALRMTKRLARQRWTDLKVSGLQRASALLQAGAVHVSQRMLELATGYSFTADGEIQLDARGQPVRVEVEHKDMIAAGKTVLGLALQQATQEKEEAANDSGDAQAWWDAAGDEEE